MFNWNVDSASNEAKLNFKKIIKLVNRWTLHCKPSEAFEPVLLVYWFITRDSRNCYSAS